MYFLMLVILAGIICLYLTFDKASNGIAYFDRNEYKCYNLPFFAMMLAGYLRLSLYMAFVTPLLIAIRFDLHM